ncbi:porin [Thioclava sp. BHET1]|nr:porin [Thioclava sp. BHET1]
MKKVLFATTALVLSAGVAAAEVSTGGTARMGVMYNGTDWNFSSRIRVKFTLSGQTDGGLEFGASLRADQANTANATGSSGAVYVSGAFGKVSMGDTVGASEALFGDLPEVGYTDLDGAGLGNIAGVGLRANIGANEIPYLTGDDGGTQFDGYNSGPNVLYTGTFGAFSVAASMSDGKDTGREGQISPNGDVDQEGAIAAAYTFGNYTVGAGYEFISGANGTEDQSQAELVGTAAFGNTSVKAYYAKGGKANPLDQGYGIGVTSVFGATTVLGYVNHAENSYNGVNSQDGTAYGIGAAYDLGGGASVVGGIADSDIDGTDTQADLGMKFSF